MNSDNIFVVLTSILNFMFFVSGWDKLLHFDKVVTGLSNRLGVIWMMPFIVYKFLVFCGLAIEIICPVVIFYSALQRNKENDRRGFYASLLLIIFTIIATLFYHFPPTNSSKYYPFMSNLSLVGGLGLMTAVFYRNVHFIP
jgi:uncharacterized membrane protein YphA (DoxX/SURF4 family)